MVFHTFAPDVTETICCIPQKYCLFECFSLCFWNLTNVSVVHRDKKNFCFCVAILFGDFSQEILDFPVINTKVDFKRGDMCAFWSKGLFHNLVVVGNRQCIILTNHSSLLEKFINIDCIF